MMPLEFTAPSRFGDEALFERIGGVIRVGGKIVGFIQEVASWVPVEVPGNNPLGLLTVNINHGVKEMLGTIQTLTTVSAVASVASLGVSIAGFAAVLAKLERMDQKLDKLLSGQEELRSLAERLHLKVDLLPVARLHAALDMQQLAMPLIDDDGRRRRLLEDSINTLAELRHYYAGLLANEELCAVKSDDVIALADAQERLVAACLGELMGEFLLGSDPSLLLARRRQQIALFDRIAWKNEKELNDLVASGDRRAGVFQVTDPKIRVARVNALAAIRAESVARLDSLCELAAFLHDKGIKPLEYMRLVEARAKETGARLLFIDAAGAAGAV